MLNIDHVQNDGHLERSGNNRGVCLFPIIIIRWIYPMQSFNVSDNRRDEHSDPTGDAEFAKQTEKKI